MPTIALRVFEPAAASDSEERERAMRRQARFETHLARAAAMDDESGDEDFAGLACALSRLAGSKC